MAQGVFRPRWARHAARLAAIGWTLARHGALPVEAFAESAPTLSFLFRLVNNRHAPGRWGQRLALALQALGPSFIKLGQVLSIRADLVGETTAEDLAGLRDRLPPFPGLAAQALIEAELGRPLDALYRSFDLQAVAAASIAQVHFAVTTDGRDVAVKVLRPGIEQAFLRDVELLRWLAELAVRWQPRWRRLKPVEAVETLARSVAAEMDLRLEAAAAAELADHFKDDPGFGVPAIDWERTSHRVMTQQRVTGAPIDRREAILAFGLNPADLLKKAADAFFRQVFRDGFFHADLHPGNMFVTPQGQLIAVDFGIMGRINRQTRLYLADMLIGFLNRDYDLVAKVHFDAGFVPRHQDRELFKQACRAIGEPLHGRPLREISIGRLLAQLFAVTEKFDMETQPQLLLLQKSMLTAEGMGRNLNPDVNMWELSRPLIEDWMRQNRGPEAKITSALVAMQAIAEEMPALIRDLRLAAARMADPQGIRLHPETLAHLRADAGRTGAGPEGRHFSWFFALIAGMALAFLILAIYP
jgi:ubiquinone biosynthesis protein